MNTWFPFTESEKRPAPLKKADGLNEQKAIGQSTAATKQKDSTASTIQLINIGPLSQHIKGFKDKLGVKDIIKLAVIAVLAVVLFAVILHLLVSNAKLEKRLEKMTGNYALHYLYPICTTGYVSSRCV